MNSQERLLTIFLYLQSGKKLSKIQLAEEFSVSPKTIQRDISILKFVLEEQHSSVSKIEFNANDNTYYLEGKTNLNKKDLLIVSKILLENRALNKQELNSILDNFFSLLSDNERKEIEDIIKSEHFNYKSLTNEKNRIETVWFISEAIRSEQMLEIDYKASLKGVRKHIILPVSLYYDAHYFYLVAYSLKKKDYLTFRIDRIENFKRSEERKPFITYGQKYKDGDLRNHKVDAFEGNKITIKLRYIGNPEIVFDQFPEHKIISEEKGNVMIQIETLDTPGLKRWILGQGEELTILSPPSLITSIQETLEKSLNNYNSKL